MACQKCNGLAKKGLFIIMLMTIMVPPQVDDVSFIFHFFGILAGLIPISLWLFLLFWEMRSTSLCFGNFFYDDTKFL